MYFFMTKHLQFFADCLKTALFQQNETKLSELTLLYSRFGGGGVMVWAGGVMVGAGGVMVGGGGVMVWAGGVMVWAGFE